MVTEKNLFLHGSMDKKAFEQLFRKYFPALMGFAGKFLSNEDDAREVVHSVFIRLWEKKEQIDSTTSLKSYLFTSVHNRSLNMIRDRKKFSETEIPDMAGDVDVSSQIEAMELEEKIREAIDTLPEKCREIFELSRFEGMKYADIADKLNISVKTVENQMSKALKVLRKKLINYLTIIICLVLYGMN